MSFEYDRDWLRSLDPTFPQIGDYMVYFPQGHIQHLLEFGDAELPFTTFSLCLCHVDGMETVFPHHTCHCMSIVLRLTLKIVGVPSPEFQLTHQPIRAFVKPPRNVELPQVVVSLRNCDLPDYLIDYTKYLSLIGKSWKPGDHFQMEFLEK